MKNRSFPRWSAPLVGTIAGALCGLRGGLNAQIPIVFCVLGGSLIGGLAGAVIFVLEPPDAVEAPVGIPIHLWPEHVASGVVGRFLAIAGCLLCWTPFLGFILNVIGLAVNWKSRDWARVASMIGLLIGSLVAITMAIGLALGIIE